jgi:hypothetical protein
VPVREWAQSWSVDFLRWRLGRPDAQYTLHVGPDTLAVSTRAPGPAKVPCAVLLKVFPRRGATLPVRGGGIVTAACRAHRTPVCIYAGWNAHVHIRGVPTPRRVQPSPLNVVYKPLDEERGPSSTFTLDTFEFLDMDAF